MKMNRAGFLKNFLKIINPLPPVGGLAVGDSGIRYALIRQGEKPLTASLRLPPGIVSEGKIADDANFRAALASLRAQISSSKKPEYVILSLPHAAVYAQSFSLPLLSEGRLRDAVRLNLEMISPADFSTVYSGWQKVGETFSGGGQSELLAAFANAQTVNQYEQALSHSGFSIAAVEFPALALARLSPMGAGIAPEKPSVMIEISGDGISLMILRNLNLYFSQFHPWRTVKEESGGREITREDFEGFLVREMQKVLNFFTSRWGGSVTNVILVADSLEAEISKLLGDSFQTAVQSLTLPDFPGMARAWYPALGSARRGVLPRAGDDALSLTEIPVRERYEQSRLLNFIRLWRNIALTASLFILVLFSAAGMFIAREEEKLREKRAGSSAPAELAEISSLQAKAEDFNRLVESALLAGEASRDVAPLMSRLTAIAADDISFNRISIAQSGVVVSGSAGSEPTVISFKDKLADDKSVENVSLPLANIKQNPDGSVSFSVTFSLRQDGP